MKTALLIQTAWAEPAEPANWGCFGTGDTVGYLLLALMLALMLLLRVHRRETAARRPVARPSPRTVDELGRFLVRAVQNDDLQAFRALYASLPELEQTRHPDIAAFADLYTGERIRKGFSSMAKRIPPGSSLESAFRVGRDALALKLHLTNGERSNVIVGTVLEVGGVFRLLQGETGARPGEPPSKAPRSA